MKIKEIYTDEDLSAVFNLIYDFLIAGTFILLAEAVIVRFFL